MQLSEVLILCVQKLYKPHLPTGSNYRLDVYHSDGEGCYTSLPKKLELARKQLSTQVCHTPKMCEDGKRRAEYASLRTLKLKNG